METYADVYKKLIKQRNALKAKYKNASMEERAVIESQLKRLAEYEKQLREEQQQQNGNQGQQESYEDQASMDNENDGIPKYGFGAWIADAAKGIGQFASENSGPIAGTLKAGMGIANYFMNKNSINNIKPLARPSLVKPTQFKTTVDVNPALNILNRSQISANKNYESSTTNSAQSNNLKLALLSKINAEKSNIYMNKADREMKAMNYQGWVNSRENMYNSQLLNQWQEKNNSIINGKTMAHINNTTNLFNNGQTIVDDFLNRQADNKKFDKYMDVFGKYVNSQNVKPIGDKDLDLDDVEKIFGR